MEENDCNGFDEADFNREMTMPADGGINYCDDDCDCDAIDNIEYGGHNLMKYMDWGRCEITPSGMEVLRFLSTIIKGKSMSSNKAQDLLRYETTRISSFLCYCCERFFLCCRYCRDPPFANPHLPASLSSCYRYCQVAHEELTGL
jgi:hypothetical protein